MYSAPFASGSLANKPLKMTGLYPATVTPFTADGALDPEALTRHLAEALQAEGVNGVVVNSGIGELLQLQPHEQVEGIRLALAQRRPGQIVIAGIEGHNPERLIASALEAKQAGADALLVLPPFDRRAYRRLNADVASVYGIFERLDREVDLPMVIFQYPLSSGSSYSIDVLVALSALRNVVAVKTATEGHLASYQEMWDRLKDRIAVLVGVDSPPLIDMLRYGSHGALIGISAIATENWGRLLRLVRDGDTEAADRLYSKACLPLMASVFQNQQPRSLMNEAAATKEALFQMGRIPNATPRFPAVAPSAQERETIRQSLLAAGLIEA
ncbi:MAG TPA: dihydrodipicolinate synthase family protein [Xanthobacteraceae bacterium]|nr:dihydrodipicolinate synthase family protein [Xanthobacteraceae bacterium]